VIVGRYTLTPVARSAPKHDGRGTPRHAGYSYSYVTFRAAAFRGRRERSSCLFLVAWEGHQADKKAK